MFSQQSHHANFRLSCRANEPSTCMIALASSRISTAAPSAPSAPPRGPSHLPLAAPLCSSMQSAIVSSRLPSSTSVSSLDVCRACSRAQGLSPSASSSGSGQNHTGVGPQKSFAQAQRLCHISTCAWAFHKSFLLLLGRAAGAATSCAAGTALSVRMRMAKQGAPRQCGSMAADQMHALNSSELCIHSPTQAPLTRIISEQRVRVER